MIADRRLSVAPAPHFWKGLSVPKIMYIVLGTLLLPTAAGVYFFGYYALSVIAVSVVAALLTEYLAKKLRGKPFVMDGSAVVTGLLLALILHPTIPRQFCGRNPSRGRGHWTAPLWDWARHDL